MVWSKSVNNNNMQVGDIMAYISYAMQVIFSFIMFSMISIILPRAIIYGKNKRSFNNRYFYKNNEIAYCGPNCETETTNVKVLNSKCFIFISKCKRKDTDNISFKAKKGEITAIIGSTDVENQHYLICPTFL